NDGLVTLVPMEAGGTFTGTGVTGSTFNPATASIGTNSITYTITTGNCTSNTVQNVNVLVSPNPSFSGLATQYCTGDAPSTLVPITSGGVFSGNGITGSTFDPSMATLGSN